MKLSTMAAMVGLGLVLFTSGGAAEAKEIVTLKFKVARAEVDLDRSIIGAAIRAVPGVANVRFDADGKLPIEQSTIVEVTYDAHVAHKNSLVNAVREAGFTADGIVPDAPAVPLKPKKK